MKTCSYRYGDRNYINNYYGVDRNVSSADIGNRGSGNFKNNGIGRIRNFGNANSYRDKVENFEAVLVMEVIEIHEVDFVIGIPNFSFKVINGE